MQTIPFEEIMQQWEKDSEVDTTEPGKEILRIPLLHNKYNKYLSLHNIAAKRTSFEIDRLKKLKWMYYNGKLDQEECSFDEFEEIEEEKWTTNNF